MTKIDQTQLFTPLLENLRANGCFVVTGNDAPNMMTIGWGTAGIMWGKEIFMVAVRVSRYTKEKLDGLKEFTICIPGKENPLAEELGFAGSQSGRDYDKAQELSLTYVPSDTVSVPYIKECAAAYECKVMYETTMSGENLDEGIDQTVYRDGDYHVLYFGEITACHLAE